jgi:hypothetical protein
LAGAVSKREVVLDDANLQGVTIYGAGSFETADELEAKLFEMGVDVASWGDGKAKTCARVTPGSSALLPFPRTLHPRLILQFVARAQVQGFVHGAGAGRVGAEVYRERRRRAARGTCRQGAHPEARCPQRIARGGATDLCRRARARTTARSARRPT